MTSPTLSLDPSHNIRMDTNVQVIQKTILCHQFVPDSVSRDKQLPLCAKMTKLRSQVDLCPTGSQVVEVFQGFQYLSTKKMSFLSSNISLLTYFINRTTFFWNISGSFGSGDTLTKTVSLLFCPRFEINACSARSISVCGLLKHICTFGHFFQDHDEILFIEINMTFDEIIKIAWKQVENGIETLESRVQKMFFFFGFVIDSVQRTR